MKRIAVIYKSKYGATKQYAEWISDELNAELLEGSKVNAARLDSYDAVIYGGGLYAGGIAGINLVKKSACKRLIVFTVGLSDPKSMDYSAVLNRNFSKEQLKNISVFHLRGGIDYPKLGTAHRLMMAALKKFVLDRKPISERSEDDNYMIANYGGQVNFTDKSSIAPIIEHVRGILA